MTGQYDKLVSIEMIEAVGHHFLDTYVNTLSQRLKPDGLALIQAITIVEQRYQIAVNSVDFIKRYIFGRIYSIDWKHHAISWSSLRSETASP